MALAKTFSNTITESQDQKVEVTELAELAETDKDTIFNLLFDEEADSKEQK